MGSAIGVAVYFLIWRWPLLWQAVVIAGLTVAGVWASGVAALHFGNDDPGHVIIDEVAGQLVTLYATGAGVGGADAGFLLFRALDIVKPWPARQFERLHGRVGIMADDLMAGAYGNLGLRLVTFVLFRT